MSEEILPKVNEFHRFIRVLFSRKVVLFGAIMIAIFIVTAIFAPLIAPYDPYEQDLGNALMGPSKAHILGTDAVGRDLFSRIIYGSRIAIIIGAVTVFISAFIGSVIGLIAGYFGGWTYTIIMRITDALMAIPPLLFVLVLSSVIGTGLTGVIISVAVALIPGYIRLICGQVVSVKENDYILAARSMRAGKFYIMFRHVLPNCITPLIVQITMMMGIAILTEASLSFLGMGIKPPTAAWGSMTYSGRQYLMMRPLLSIAPGFAVMLLVFSFNMVGDGLRDALDPKLRGVI